MSSPWPALILAGILPFGGDRVAEPFPVEARGDIPFHLDAARFDSLAGSPIEIYLSVPQAALTESADSAAYSRIGIEVGFEDADGDDLAKAEEEFWIPLRPPSSGDAVLAARHLLTLRPALAVSARQIRVRIVDREGRKSGLLDRVRSKRRSGEARGRFETDPRSCGFSDPVFVWELDRSPESAALPVRRRLRPNPLRYYGLYHSTLLFYVEEAEASSGSGVVSFRIRTRPGGRTVFAASDSARPPAGGPRGYLEAVDLTAFPSGAYRIELSGGGDGADSCIVAGEFQVLWDDASWNQDRQSLLEEAYVLLGNAEYEKVELMSRGEIESYMHALWTGHDPDPTTGRNELRDRYRERVAHAENFFGTSLRRGMLTDRGRVYVRYGPPDEITKELNPQDQDMIARILPGEVASDRSDIIRKPVPRGIRDDSAYEIWTYQIRGDPLFPEQEIPVQRTGLKFIFVDELGYGDMRLIYTNLSGAF